MIHLDENNEFKYTQTVSEEEFNNLIDGNLFKLFASR
jgi:hypothetical protein